jgi:tetratricopeptide (TPR) repeat protein
VIAWPLWSFLLPRWRNWAEDSGLSVTISNVLQLSLFFWPGFIIRTHRSLKAKLAAQGKVGWAGHQEVQESGRKDEARKLLAELKEQSKRRYVPPYWLAMIYAGLDEKDEAFAWLEKAYQERSFFLLWIKTDPMVDSLRSDSRFVDLVRRIGFP